jgi:hypothetical protein
VDRAVFYAIATRAWQFVAGPISILVIAAFFTPELQGYFYTFASLMGMQTLVELGLHGVVINVSSHEWSRLQLAADGSIVGDAEALRRLAGLKRFVARWYAMVAFVFFIVCGVGGAVFLDQPRSAGAANTAGSMVETPPVTASRPGAAGDVPGTAVALPREAWIAPWFCLVALNGLLLWAWAFSAMLEGCNQMIVVHRVRLLQFMTGSLAVWASMAAGLGLWAAVVSVAVRLAWDFWLIAVRYRRFWQSLPGRKDDPAISWRREIWPLQWKMAVSGIAGYLAFSLFTPVMFYFHGPVVAGRMGMTWTILTAIESAAFAWVQVRGPLFGILAARRDWREMDRVFVRLTAISWMFYLLGAVGLCTGVWGLNALPWPLTQRLASRMLALEPTAVFAAGFLLLHLPRCQTIYVRAHKQDPFLVAGIVSHGLTAVLIVALGKAYGPIGAAWGLLAVVALVDLPWWTQIWNRCRRDWHQVSDQVSPVTGIEN